MTLKIIDDLDDAHEQTLVDQLIHFNVLASPLWDANHNEDFSPQRLHLYLLDADGQLQGGLTGRTHGIRDWLEIGLLWVDPKKRGQGFGRNLVDRAELDASRRGCRHARLATSAHQSPGFYERLGYTEYGRLEDCPPGETALYFRKDLPTN